VDVIREQVGSDAVVALFARTAMADNCDQVIEEEKGAAGKVLIASLRDALRRAGSPAAVHAAPTTGDKVTRAYMASAAWSHEPSKFAVVEADWTDIYLDEMESFPHGAHDDLVDGTSHGFNWLEGRAYLVGDFRMPGQPAEDAPDTRMPVDPPHRPSQIGSFRVPGQG
jgi:predicted phage terminase large subunit-like protein